MADAALEKTITNAWEARADISPATRGEVRDAVDAALSLLDAGKERVAQKAADGSWTVNQWLKKAVLLSFRLNDNVVIPGPGGTNWWDKVPSKFEGWGRGSIPRGRLPGSPGRHCPTRCLHRTQRHPDAELRQYRRLCR